MTGDNLLVEKLSGLTKLDILAGKIWNKKLAPFLYVTLFWVLSLFITPLATKSILSEEILIKSVIILSLYFGIVGSKKMRDKYIESFNPLGDLDEKFPHEFWRLFILVTGIIIFIAWIVVSFGFIKNPLTGEVAKHAIHYGKFDILLTSVQIIGFFPVVADFTYYFFSTLLFLPIRFRKEKPDLDFTDTKRMGGLKEMGDALLATVQIYYIGLTALTGLFLYSFGLSWIGPGMLSFFSGGWILGIALFFLPSFLIHNHMKKQKEEKLKEIRDEIQKAGSEVGGRVDVSPKSSSEKIEYIHLYLEHEHLYNMSEHPFDVSTLQSLFLTSLLPLVLQLGSYVVT